MTSKAALFVVFEQFKTMQDGLLHNVTAVRITIIRTYP